MHPIILHELVKAHTSDLHRQAGRDAPSLAARRARQASASSLDETHSAGSGGRGRPRRRSGGLASYLCQAVGEAGRSAVVSRIWVVALGVVALAASCTAGCGAGPNAGGLAVTPPPGRRVPPTGSVLPVGAFRSAGWPAASIPSSRETSSATLRSSGRRKLFPPALPARPRTRRSSPWDRTSW